MAEGEQVPITSLPISDLGSLKQNFEAVSCIFTCTITNMIVDKVVVLHH
jgi:hypothetical protein